MRHRILLNQEEIARRVGALALEIAAFYEGREVTLVAIYNGAVLFAADLLRNLDLPVRFETLSVASYEGTESSGKVAFLQKRLPDLEGRHVLLVDDVLDTGKTLAAVKRRLLWETAPESLRTVVLLRKAKAAAAGLSADWTGFEIGNEFVIGYGLDLNGRYRNLPYVAVVEEPAEALE